MEGEFVQSSAATLDFVSGFNPEVSWMHLETGQSYGGKRKFDVYGVLRWEILSAREAAVTSEPVASSRERHPGVLLGPSRSRKCKAKRRERPLERRCALHKAGAGAGRQGGDAHCPLRVRRCLSLNPKGLLICVEVCPFDFQRGLCVWPWTMLCKGRAGGLLESGRLPKAWTVLRSSKAGSEASSKVISAAWLRRNGGRC